MRKHKKVILITLVTVVVLAATLGVVAFAQADDQGTQTVKDTLFERVAQDYQANTGNAIDAAKLQEAFTQAQKELATEAQDRMWQKLIDEGKITKKQLDDYKTWLAARPNMTTDEFKQWMESKPEGIPFGPGQRGPALQRGLDQMGKMFRGWCAPNNAD
jgi:hypothetical protein